MSHLNGLQHFVLISYGFDPALDVDKITDVLSSLSMCLNPLPCVLYLPLEEAVPSGPFQ